ncbi:TPA: hypothetical protein ACH3X1_009748 [Trebouxia sp. C0004]
MLCTGNRASDSIQMQVDMSQDAVLHQQTATDTGPVPCQVPATALPDMTTEASSAYRPDRRDPHSAAELPSEGILRSYAASQQLQLDRQQSLSHHSVLPFLRTISLEQALLTYVPYIPISVRKELCSTGAAATAA